MFEDYIQQYSPETEAFFRPRPKAEDEKMPRLRVYTVGYRTKTHRISDIYPILPPNPIYFSFHPKNGTSSNNQKNYCLNLTAKRHFIDIWYEQNFR